MCVQALRVQVRRPLMCMCTGAQRDQGCSCVEATDMAADTVTVRVAMNLSIYGTTAVIETPAA